MKQYITQIIIRPSKLTQQSAYIINSLDVLKGSKNILKQGVTKTNEPYVVIKTELYLTKAKGDLLKRTLKSLLNAEHVSFVLTEK